jgi:hypothetical protein
MIINSEYIILIELRHHVPLVWHISLLASIPGQSVRASRELEVSGMDFETSASQL